MQGGAQLLQPHKHRPQQPVDELSHTARPRRSCSWWGLVQLLALCCPPGAGWLRLLQQRWVCYDRGQLEGVSGSNEVAAKGGGGAGEGEGVMRRV